MSQAKIPLWSCADAQVFASRCTWSAVASLSLLLPHPTTVLLTGGSLTRNLLARVPRKDSF